MTFALFIKLEFSSAVVFFTLDMIWLGLVARGFYRSQIGSDFFPFLLSRA